MLRLRLDQQGQGGVLQPRVVVGGVRFHLGDGGSQEALCDLGRGGLVIMANSLFATMHARGRGSNKEGDGTGENTT